MFKGNEDSSQSQNQGEVAPIIDKASIVNPKISVEHLICSICFHVVWEPVVCGSVSGCHNSFCSSCMSSWLQKNKLCPTCKKSFCFGPVPPILNSVLMNLVVQCLNHQNGCTCEISYSNLLQHLRQCEYKLQKCKGCHNKIIKKEFPVHVANCDQFMVQCDRCKLGMSKADFYNHSRIQCFAKQIVRVENRLTSIEHDLQEVNSAIQKLDHLTNCFLSGQALQMNIELYTTFNQHFIFPNPTLIKPSFNQQKEKFDFLHFYVLNPIYTDSIASIKWALKINKMIGNILIGFCSSMTINSLDYVINKYGDIKRKNNNESKYKLVRKNQTGFVFGCGDIIKFKYASLDRCIKIWNQTKRVGMVLNSQEVEQLGEKVYTFYSMDTLNDSLSFV